MSDLKPEPLDYATPKPDAKDGIWLGWSAVLLVIVQLIWFLPSIFLELDLVEDGSSKQPFRDFSIYLVMIAPSIAAIGFDLWHCWVQYREFDSFRNCKRSIFVLLVAGLFVAWTVFGWIDEDIVNRAIPHGLW